MTTHPSQRISKNGSSSDRLITEVSDAEVSADLTAEERSVIDSIRRTAFGTIEVVLHQQRIVQVVRSEKTRFD